MNNSFSTVGTVATDPQQYVFENGSVKCGFRLAVSERRKDRDTGAWVDAGTNWFTVNVYRTLAEHGLLSLRKGDRVFVSGRLHIKQWEKPDGRSGISAEIDAEALGHDLRFGTTAFTKTIFAKSSEDSGAARAQDTGEKREDGAFGPLVIEDVSDQPRGKRSGRAA